MTKSAKKAKKQRLRKRAKEALQDSTKSKVSSE